MLRVGGVSEIVKQVMKKGFYGYCVPCANSFEDLVTHKRDIHPRGYRTVYKETGDLHENQYSGRIFCHTGTKEKPGCCRLVRVSRDWDHKNPQATEPPEHDECVPVKRIPKQSGIGSILVTVEGVVVDDGINSLPVLEAHELAEQFEDERD